MGTVLKYAIAIVLLLVVAVVTYFGVYTQVPSVETVVQSKLKVESEESVKVPIIKDYPETAFPQYASSKASKQLYTKIIQLQYPQTCETAPKMYFPEWPYGFGSSTHVQLYTLDYSLKYNRTWIPHDIDTWNHFKFSIDDPDCIIQNRTGQSCYFKPLTKCTVSAQARQTTYNQDYQMMQDPNITDFWATNWMKWPLDQNIYKSHEKGFLWYQSQIVSYLFRLQPNIQHKCEAYKTKLGWKSTDVVVGMHVRHGDKFLESPPFHFSKYMDIVKQKHSSVNKIFLSSDDSYTLLESYANKDYSHFEFLWIKEDKFLKDYEKFKMLLCELYLLSECNYFVGTFSSNLGRLAWELMYAKNKKAKSTSLDSGWYGTP